MRGGSLLLFFCSCFIFSLPLRSDRGRFSRLLFFSSLSLLLFVFFGCSDGMEREACVCDHGYERSDLCAEIIIIIMKGHFVYGILRSDRNHFRGSRIP